MTKLHGMTDALREQAWSSLRARKSALEQIATYGPSASHTPDETRLIKMVFSIALGELHFRDAETIAQGQGAK